MVVVNYTGRQIDIMIELLDAQPSMLPLDAMAEAGRLERKGRGAVFRRWFPWWAWVLHAGGVAATQGAWIVAVLIHFTYARYRVHHWTHGVTGRIPPSRPPPGRRRSRR